MTVISREPNSQPSKLASWNAPFRPSPAPPWSSRTFRRFFKPTSIFGRHRRVGEVMRRRKQREAEPDLQTAVVLAQLNAVVDRLEGVYEQLQRLTSDTTKAQPWKN